MSVSWTREDIERFDQLIDETGSSNQVKRINGRLDMNKFIAKHGKEKCDAMWNHLENGGKLEALK